MGKKGQPIPICQILYKELIWGPKHGAKVTMLHTIVRVWHGWWQGVTRHEVCGQSWRGSLRAGLQMDVQQWLIKACRDSEVTCCCSMGHGRSSGIVAKRAGNSEAERRSYYWNARRTGALKITDEWSFGITTNAADLICQCVLVWQWFLHGE